MTAAAADEVALAILRFDDGEEILVAFDPDQPRGPDGRWIELGFGQLKLPGLSSPSPRGPGSPPTEDSAFEKKLATLPLADLPEPLGGGTSDTYKGELEDGTPVMIKKRIGENWLRDDVDATHGLEHAKAAARISDYLGVETPKIKNRTVGSLKIADPMGIYFDDPDEEVQVQEWMPDFDDWNAVEEKADPYYGEGMIDTEIDKDDAERLTLLDAVIGNTDRHDGNFGLTDGELTAIDMDLTFPKGNEEPWGNYLRWTDEDTTEEIWREKLDPELKKKIKDMIDHKAEWDAALIEDGLTDKERSSMWNRIRSIDGSVWVPYPPSEAGEDKDERDWQSWSHTYVDYADDAGFADPFVPQAAQ
jgi:hypothetical protein